MYLGIDVGSTSVKGVLINANDQIFEHAYIKNFGITNSMSELLKKLNVDKYVINGIGVTGSGRDFLNAMIGADIVKNEILAHYTAAVNEVPGVKTIFEIGGEDAKLITVEDGVITDFAMNTSCAAGVGSMIENISNRLGVNIENVGSVALKSKSPAPIAGKCAVFSQSTAINKRNSGAAIEDILAGVVKATIDNYMTILVRNRKIEPPFLFQGATAWNIGLKKYFEDAVQHEVEVPDHPHLMGAIGMALICKEDNIDNPRSIDVNSEFDTNIRIGKLCSNSCEIIEVMKDGEVTGSVGARCDKCL